MLFKKKKFAKRASVYISDKHKQIIIVPRHINKAGVIYEQEICRTKESMISNLDLGTEIMECMNLFTLNDTNLRDSKLTDWPAYKHSKSKSVKAFEQEYIFISIASANEYNLIIEIEGFPKKDSELTVMSSVSFYADKEIIGERVLRVYDACLTGKI